LFDVKTRSAGHEVTRYRHAHGRGWGLCRSTADVPEVRGPKSAVGARRCPPALSPLGRPRTVPRSPATRSRPATARPPPGPAPPPLARHPVPPRHRSPRYDPPRPRRVRTCPEINTRPFCPPDMSVETGQWRAPCVDLWGGTARTGPGFHPDPSAGPLKTSSGPAQGAQGAVHSRAHTLPIHKRGRDPPPSSSLLLR